MVDHDLPGHDHGLGTTTGIGQTSLEDQLVQVRALLHTSGVDDVGHTQHR